MKLYIVLPDGTILYGDYSQALTHEAIKWAHWTYELFVTSLEIVSIEQLVLGTNGVRV